MTDWIEEQNVITRDAVWLLVKFAMIVEIVTYPILSWFVDSSQIREEIRDLWRRGW
jgi:hypothetical protein